MWFPFSFWKRNCAPAACAKRCGQRHSKSLLGRSLQVEPLEKRELLAVCHWVGGGSDNLWSTAANWQEGAAPVAGDDLVFQGTTQTTTQNDLAAGTAFHALEFSASNFSVSGNALALTGSITVDSGVTNSTVSADVALTGTVIVTATDTSLSLSGTVSGSGLLQKAGTGTLSLLGSNSYTGGTRINGGTLAFAAGGLGTSGTIAFTGISTLQWAEGNTEDISSRLTSNANATIDVGSNTVYFASALPSMNYTLTKAGSGTLILTGNNGFNAGTIISAGTLQLGDGGTTGTVPYSALGAPIQNNATLVFNRSNAYSLTDCGITGSGDVIQNGSGALTFSKNNSYTGTTTINAGSLALGGTSTCTGGTVVNAGVLSFGANGLGSGDITVSGAGTLRWYSGNTIDISDRLVLADGAVATLDTNGNNVTLANGFGNNSSASLVKVGTGTLALAGNNTYTGGTTINAGTVAFASGGLGTSGSITLGTSGTVTWLDGNTQDISDRLVLTDGTTATLNVGTNNVTFATAFGNNSTAILAKAGTGTLSLLGSNSYTGGTTINAGTLAFTAGALGTSGSVTFNGTSTLQWAEGNTEDISSRLHINNIPNATVDVGNNTVTFASSLNSTTATMTKAGAGTLILTASSTGFNNGTIISAGTLQIGDGGTTGTVPYSALGTPIQNNSTLVFNRSNAYDLTDFGISGSGGVIQNGTGALTFRKNNSYTGTTTINAGSLALGGTSTCTGGIVVNAGVLSFGANGLGSGNVTVSGAGTLRWYSGNTIDISDRLVLADGVVATLDTNGNNVTLASGFGNNSSASLVKAGTGTLTLAGSNTYTGGTTINAGTVAFASGGVGTSGSITLGTAGTVTWLEGNTQDISDRLVLTNGTTAALNVGTNNVTFATAFGNNSTAILAKAGTGTLSLLGSNSYTGGTKINAGTLAFTAGALGTSGSVTFTGTSALQWAEGNTEDISSRLLIDNTNLNATIDVGSNTVTFASTLDSTTGTLTKAGAGTLILTAANNGFNNGTIISAGTLQIGNGGTTGVLPYASVQNNASLAFNRSDNITFEKAIRGTGTVTQNGTGAVTLSGNNSYTGTTTVNSGSLVLTGASTCTGGTVVNGGILSFAANSVGSGSITASGTSRLRWYGTNTMDISDRLVFTDGAVVTLDTNGNNITLASGFGNGSSAAVTKIANGTLTLLGTNTYTGGTAINAGAIAFGSGGLGTSGPLNVAASSTLAWLEGNTQDISARLNLSNGVTATLDVGVNTVTFATGIGTTTAAIKKAGSGTLILAAANAYSGTTTVSAGVLQVGDGATAGTLGTGAVTNNATLTFNRSDLLTVSNAISGTGTVVQNGTGTLALTGNNSYSGGGVINAGTLRIGHANAVPGGSGKGNLTVNGTLDLNGLSITTNGLSGTGLVTSGAAGAVTWTVGSNNQTSTFSGVIQNGSGTVALTKTGTGKLTLAGDHTYTGNTTVSQGELDITGTLASGTTTVGSNGTLSGNGLVHGLTINGGILAPGDSGVGTLDTGNLSLTSASTYRPSLGDTAASKARVTGTLNLGSSSLNLASTRAAHFGDVLVVLENDGTDAITGTFLSLPEGSTVVANGVSYSITYGYDAETGSLGTGNDVALIDQTPLQAISDSYTTTENHSVSGNVLTNDLAASPGHTPSVTEVTIVTPEGTTTTAIASGGFATVTTPAGGTLLLHADGSFTYSPATSFTGLDGANSTDSVIRYVAADATGTTSPVELQFTVANATLNATDGADLTASEGTSTGTMIWCSFTDDSGNSSDTTEYTATITWDDGNTSSGTILANGQGGFDVSASHVYADNGVYVATIQISDNDGATVSAETNVIVTNVAPTPTITGPTTGVQGILVSLTGTATDPGADTVSLVWTVTKDGVAYASGSGGTIEFTPDGNALYLVTLTASDEDGASAAATHEVAVLNTPPVPSLSGPTTAAEGDLVGLLGSATDSDGDTVSLSWSVTKNGVAFATGTGGTVEFTPNDNGLYNVTLLANDGHGGTATTEHAVTVTNVAPTPTLSGLTTGQEGTALSFTGTASDPGDDTLSFAWSVTKNGEAFASGTGTAIEFTPNNDGQYTLTLTASDEDGGSADIVSTVAVVNVAPTPFITGLTTGSEGVLVTLTGSATDPGTDTVALSWSVTKNGTAYASGAGSTIEFTPDDEGLYDVTLTASDQDGGSQSVTSSITVANVAPLLTISGAANAEEGAVYSVTLSSNDPGEDAIANWVINWGDDSDPDGDGVVGETVSGAVTSATHRYARGSVQQFTITAVATDEDGSYAANSLTITANTPPLAPSDLEAAAFSDSQVTLQWTDNSLAETGYKIERSQDGTNWTQIAVTAANSTRFSDTTVSAHTIYSYRVCATNSTSDSTYSNTSSVTTPMVLTWDPDGVNDGHFGAVGDQTSDWTAADAWVDASGQRYTWDSTHSADRVILQGDGGTINLPSALAVGRINVTSVGYTLNGAALTLSGVGTVLAADESLTFSMSVNVGADQTWSVTAGKALTVANTVALADHILTIEGAGATTISGVVSGTGVLAKTGTGSLSLTGTNTYSGGTTIQAGTVAFASGGLGTSGTVAVHGEATLQWAGTNADDLSSRLAIAGGVTATLDLGANDVAFATGFTGQGQAILVKATADEATALSVPWPVWLGEDLTYTWAVTTKPEGAADPQFSDNATSTAQSVLAIFDRTGDYVLTATIANAAGQTATTVVHVSVAPSLGYIVVTPMACDLGLNESLQFSAQAYDQFADPIETLPSLTWAATSGGITADGLYTAPSSAAEVTITATVANGTISGTCAVTVANQSPELASEITTSTTPVSGTSTVLTVLGSDDGGEANLSYAWTVTRISTGETLTGFSANGTNAAKSTTFSFDRAGTYLFSVTISDALGLSTQSSAYVAVAQTLTTISVTSASAPTTPLNAGGTLQLSAVGYDQFGDAMAEEPQVTWNASVGTIDGDGLYTAPHVSASATVTAQNGMVVSEAYTVVTLNQAPTVATPAAAEDSSVSGVSTTLAVAGSDDAGEANLTYTWTVTALPTDATAPTFASNGTHAASSTEVTFEQAGVYTFLVTIADEGEATVTSSVTVTVAQTATTITVGPGSVTVDVGDTAQFWASAFDQFGDAITGPGAFQWSATAGSIDATGLFTAPNSAMPATVTATLGNATGSCSVTISNSTPTTSLRLGDSTTTALTEAALTGQGHVSLIHRDEAIGETTVTLSTGFVVSPTATFVLANKGNYTSTPAPSTTTTQASWTAGGVSYTGIQTDVLQTTIIATLNGANWTYHEEATVSYTVTTSANGATSSTANGSYSYTFDASGDDTTSSFTCVTVVDMTTSGTSTTTTDTSSFTMTWTQDTNTTDTVSNTTNLVTGAASGSHSGSGSTTSSYSGSGSFSSGSITGTASASGSDTTSYGFAITYTHPAGGSWTSTGSASNHSSGNSNSSYSGGGPYNSAGPDSSFSGSVSANGTDVASYDYSTQYTWAGSQWQQTGGSGSTSGHGSTHASYTGSGSFTSGSTSGTFGASGHDDTSYAYSTSASWSSGSWSHTGTDTVTADGASDSSYSATGTTANGTVSASGSDHSTYSYSESYSLNTQGAWQMTNRSGGSSGGGGMHTSYVGTDSISDTGNGLTGSVSFSGGENSSYEYSTHLTRSGDDWVNTGTATVTTDGSSGFSYTAGGTTTTSGGGWTLVGMTSLTGNQNESYSFTLNYDITSGGVQLTSGTGSASGGGETSASYTATGTYLQGLYSGTSTVSGLDQSSFSYTIGSSCGSDGVWSTSGSASSHFFGLSSDSYTVNAIIPITGDGLSGSQTITESGSDESNYNYVTTSVLSGGSWNIATGSGGSSAIGSNSTTCISSGSYTASDANSSYHSTFQSTNNENRTYNGAITAVFSAGGWIENGSNSITGQGSSNYSSSGNGTYSNTASSGTFSQSESGQETYSYAVGYLLTNGTWDSGNGNGMSAGSGSSHSSYSGSGSYTSTINYATIHGRHEESGNSDSSYNYTTSATLVNGVWSQNGTATANGGGSDSYAYSGQGSYSSSGTDLQISGTCTEDGGNDDSYNWSASYSLTFGDWQLQSEGCSGSGSFDSSFTGSGNYSRTNSHSGADASMSGRVSGTFQEGASSSGSYHGHISASYVDAVWTETGSGTVSTEGESHTSYTGEPSSGTITWKGWSGTGTFTESATSDNSYQYTADVERAYGGWRLTAVSGGASGSSDSQWSVNGGGNCTVNNTIPATSGGGTVPGVASGTFSYSQSAHGSTSYSTSASCDNGFWVEIGEQSQSGSGKSEGSYTASGSYTNGIVTGTVNASGDASSEYKYNERSLISGAGASLQLSGKETSSGKGSTHWSYAGTGYVSGSGVESRTENGGDNSSYNYNTTNKYNPLFGLWEKSGSQSSSSDGKRHVSWSKYNSYASSVVVPNCALHGTISRSGTEDYTSKFNSSGKLLGLGARDAAGTWSFSGSGRTTDDVTSGYSFSGESSRSWSDGTAPQITEYTTTISESGSGSYKGHCTADFTKNTTGWTKTGTSETTSDRNSVTYDLTESVNFSHDWLATDATHFDSTRDYQKNITRQLNASGVLIPEGRESTVVTKHGYCFAGDQDLHSDEGGYSKDEFTSRLTSITVYDADGTVTPSSTFTNTVQGEHLYGPSPSINQSYGPFDVDYDGYYVDGYWRAGITSGYLANHSSAQGSSLGTPNQTTPTGGSTSSAGPGFGSLYWHYLTNPSQMDPDLRLANNVAYGMIGTGVGGLVGIGVGALAGAGVHALALELGASRCLAGLISAYAAGDVGSQIGFAVGRQIGGYAGSLGETIGGFGASIAGSFAPGTGVPWCFAAGTEVLVPGETEGSSISADAAEMTVSSESDGLIACATVVVGLSGWYADARQTRQKRKKHQNIMDLLFPHHPDEDLPERDQEACSTASVWADRFVEELAEDESWPWWRERSHDDSAVASDCHTESDGRAIPESPLATASVPMPIAPVCPLSSPIVEKPIERREVFGPDRASHSGRGWGRWWLAACLVLASLLGLRAWFLPTTLADQHTHACVAPTAPASLKIEEIHPGQRVVACNPDPASSARSDEPEIDPATWRFLRLRADYRWPDGTVDPVDVETIQSPEWVEAMEAQPGAVVPLPLDLVEMGLPEDLDATVLSNEPCPPIPVGPGSVVQSTVTHLNPNLYELTLQDTQGHRQTVRPTGLHRLYSEDRNCWLRTEELQEGEHLRGLSGSLALVRRERVPGVHRVYNMTVHGEHVFHVSALGLLSHNTQTCSSGGPAPKKKNISVQHSTRKEALEAAAHAHKGKPRPTPPKSDKAKRKLYEEAQKYKRPENHPLSKYPESHFHDSIKSLGKQRGKPNVHHTYPE